MSQERKKFRPLANFQHGAGGFESYQQLYTYILGYATLWSAAEFVPDYTWMFVKM
jgi:hypothetical protein